MEIVEQPVRRRSGRPPSFDRDEALHRAMLVFWRHGYESTSLADLTTAMGISPPSLYTAFGDKKRLFLACVERYMAGGEPPEAMIAAAPSARDAARRLLEGAVVGVTGEDTPAGCLVATGAIACSAAADDVQRALANIRGGMERALRERIARDVVAGELPTDTDPEALGAHAMAVVQGLSTLARDGAPRAKLLRVVEQAIRAWP